MATTSPRRVSKQLSNVDIKNDPIYILNELTEKCTRLTLQILSEKKINSKLVSTNEFSKLDENTSKLVRQIHEKTSIKLHEWNKAIALSNRFYVPKEMLEEIKKVKNSLSSDYIESFFNEGLPLELKKLGLQDFITAINRGLEQHDKRPNYLKAARKKVADYYAEAFHKKNTLCPTDELSSARKYILKLFEIDDFQIKERVLKDYIDLCESDPITNESWDGLVECLTTLLEWSPSYNRLNNSLLILIAKSLSLTLECMLLHMSGSHVSAQRSEIKEQALKVTSAIGGINFKQIRELTFYSLYAQQASQLIRTENSLNSDILEGIITTVRFGVKLSQAILTPSGENLAGILEETKILLLQVCDKIHWSEQWFQQAIALKKATRLALFQHSLFRQLIKVFRSTPSVDSNITESQIHIIFCYLENLEMAILRSPDEKVRIEAFKLLVHYLYLDHSIIQQRAVQILIQIFEKGDSKLKNSSHIILELIQAQMSENGKNEERLEAFLSTFQSDLGRIISKDEFYPQIIKYLMHRSLDIRLYDDISGLSLLHLLPYTSKSVKCFLKVFKSIPAIAQDTKDIRGNTPSHHAAMNGNHSFIKQFHDSFQCLLDTANLYGDLPTHMAIEKNHPIVLEALLDLGSSCDGKNSAKETLMHVATRKQLPKVIEILCQKQADPNQTDGHFKKPLNLAIESNFIDGIDILERYGATIVEEEFGITPLMIAAKLNLWNVAIYYLDRKNPTLMEMGEIIQMICSDHEHLTISPRFIAYFLKKIFRSREFYNCLKNFLSTNHPRFFLASSDQREEIFKISKITFTQEAPPEIFLHLFLKDYQNPIFDSLSRDTANIKDPGGFTLLMHLAHEDSQDALNLAKKILMNGGDPSIEHPCGLNAQYIASLVGNDPFLKLINAPSSPIQIEVSKDFDSLPEIIKKILRKEFEEALTHDVYGNDSLKCSPLMYLAEHRNESALDLAGYLIKKGVDPQQKNCLETDVIIAACTHSNIPYLEYLKKQGVRLDVKCAQEFTPFHIAALNRDLTLAKFLVDNGIDPNVKNRFSETPLHIFCGYHQTFVPTILSISPVNNLKILITKSIKANPGSLISVADYAPLETKDEEQELSFLEMLLEKVDPYAQDGLGDTCLHRAVRSGKASFISAILNKCPPLFWKKNTQGEIPISLYFKQNRRTRNPKIISAFSDCKIPLDELDDLHGITIAHIAAAANLKDFLRMLFSKKADLATARTKINGQTPLHVAAEVGFTEMLDFYTDDKLDVLDDQGNTVIHYAALYGQNTFIKEVMRRRMGTNLHLKANQDGRISLHLAAQKGHLETVQLLVNQYNSPYDETDHSGEIPMHIATRNGHDKVVLYFHEMNRNLVSLTNDDGLGVLHMCAQRGHAKIVCDLIQKDLQNDQIPAHLDTAVEPLSPGLPDAEPQSPSVIYKQNFEKSLLTRLPTEDMKVKMGHLEMIVQQRTWYENTLAFKPENSSLQLDPQDVSGHTPLFTACLRGHSFVARALLLAGASAYKTNELGETSLHAAAYGAHPAMVKDIIRFSRRHLETKPITQEVDLQEETALHEVFKHEPLFDHVDKESERVSIINYLVKHKVAVNKGDENGRTALHIAMSKNLTTLANALLLASQDYERVAVEVQDHKGNTPLHDAAAKGFLTSVKFLLSPEVLKMSKEYGIAQLRKKKRISRNKINHKNETPLFLAAINGHEDIFNFLRQNGGKIDVKNGLGQNLFHAIFSLPELTESHKKILKELHEHYPRGVYETDKQGNICLNLLAQKGWTEAANNLLRMLPGSRNQRESFLKKSNHQNQTVFDLATPDFLQFLTRFSRYNLGADSTVGVDTLTRIIERFTFSRRSSTSDASSGVKQSPSGDELPIPSPTSS